MADSKKRGPINGVHSELVAMMVDHQITGLFDRVRMHEFWQRLLAGDNDPKVISEGLCQALSGGHYIKGPDRNVTINITVQGDPNPQALAASLADEVERAMAKHG